MAIQKEEITTGRIKVGGKEVTDENKEMVT
jgi:hypothetical protein